MARLQNKLSALQVQRLTAPGMYSDGNGLWLQIAGGQTKSWVFRYDRDGRRNEMGLGPLHQVTLAAARACARELREQLRAGRDPLAERRELQRARQAELAHELTFDRCARDYIASHRAGWKNAKHADQWTNTLATYASPVLGHVPVAQIDTALVLAVLKPIWTTKTETATRVRARVEKVLDAAKTLHYRTGENPARWKGHLDTLLPAPRKVTPVVHHPALPWERAPSFMLELRERSGWSTRALEFTIHTAVRSNEVREATWGEIDLKARLWTIPAARMKGNKEHWVPLSEEAVALLQTIPHRTGWLFPGEDEEALSDMALTEVLRRMGYHDITVHGFRSTFRTWAGNAPRNRFAREVCEHALAHHLPDKTEAAYQRETMLAKRRPLMRAWSRYLCSLTHASG